MTFGLGPAGYDVRIAETLWVWPLWGRLASTVEHFTLPDDVSGRVYNKSSLARRFTLQPSTVLEPGWRGYLTLELVRWLPWPTRIKAGTPIAHIIFERLEEPTEQPYTGKYQDQEAGPQPARAG
jgi:dCTP deaminase